MAVWLIVVKVQYVALGVQMNSGPDTEVNTDVAI